MKKFWKIILISFIVVLTLSSIGYFGFYQPWGRKLIYSEGSKLTKYSGKGNFTRAYSGRIFVEYKGEGRPFFDDIAEKFRYPEKQYKVTEIPATDQIIYTVGIFKNWEDISGSKDKYLVILNPATSQQEKHRVSFEESDLFKDNATRIAVENVSYKFNKSENKIVNPKPNSLITLGFDKVRNILKEGDAIILMPVFDPPDVNKKDGEDNLLSSWIVTRRVGDKL